MSMQDEDFLLRQVRQLAAALATWLAGKAATATDDQASVSLLDEAEGWARSAGIGVQAALALPPASLGALLTTDDGLDAPRALLLGLALRAHALACHRRGQPDAAQAAETRGRWLIEAALRDRLDLQTDELLATLAALGPSNAPPRG